MITFNNKQNKNNSNMRKEFRQGIFMSIALSQYKLVYIKERNYAKLKLY